MAEPKTETTTSRNGKGVNTAEKAITSAYDDTTHSGKMGEYGAHVTAEVADEGGAENRLEDQMNNEHLKMLQNIFEEADEDSGGGLDMEEFRKAMRKTMGAGVLDHELDMLFMKVDTNCDGGVDWDEYLTYMLLEYQEREMMAQLLKEKPLPTNVRKFDSRQRELIQKICFLPSSRTSIDLGAGRYATMGKDGTISFWSLELTHRGSSRLDPFDKERSQSLWVTDMVCIYNHNLLAFTTTESDIYFVDIGAGKFDNVFMVVGLPHPLLCMDYWANFEIADQAHLFIGDASGAVYAYTFIEIPGAVGLFGIPTSKDGKVIKIAHEDIMKGRLPCVSGKVYRPLHLEWVKQVKYIPEISAFISCALSNDVSMVIVEIADDKPSYVFSTRRGITCFDYDPSQGVIVTGGMDCTVRVWNTYMTHRPSMLFIGHNAPISHIIARPCEEQAISLSKDKCVKVWDLREQVCVQTISPQRLRVHVSLPAFTSMFFNSRLQQLVMAGQIILVTQRNQAVAAGEKEDISHERVITGALYNNLFNKVVTGCHGSVINVWELCNGGKVMQFRNAHTIVRNGQRIAVEITCMIFDPTLRRLITGGRDGKVKIWNFNNGACLRVMETDGNKEVTSLILAKQRIVTCGWNHGVTVFLDDREDKTVRKWMIRHKEDILTVDFKSPSLVATGAYDGEIIIWNLETGHLYTRLSAHGQQENTYVVPEMEDKLGLAAMTKYKEKQKNMVLAFAKREIIAREEQKRKTSESKKRRQFIDGDPAWLNESSSESDSLDSSATEKSESVVEEDNPKEFPKAIHKLLFLGSRVSSKGTATLIASCADGFIYAWSLHHEGGLLHKFRACTQPNDYCLTVATDMRNRYLITGDTAGYVKIWLLENYCTENPPDTDWNYLVPKFPFLGHHLTLMRKMLKLEWLKSSFKPRILTSFRAHLKTVMSVDFVEMHDLLVTCSSDCSVRLWTLCGRFIGTFGQKTLWNISLPVVPVELPRRMPADIRRVASSSTLKVLHGGKNPKWAFVQLGIMMWCKEMMRSEDEQKERSKRMREARKKQKRRQQSSDVDLDRPPDEQQPILGYNYARRERLKPVPQVPPTQMVANQAMAFTRLPFIPVQDITQPAPPPLVQQLLEDRVAQKQENQRTRRSVAAKKT